MRVHERTIVTQKAEAELQLFLVELRNRHDLTFAEIIQMLAILIGNYIHFQIRYERSDRREDGY